MRVMHVNVTAAFVLTQHLLPLLRASQDAAVLFTSSGVGNRGRAYWGAYSISKFAVEGFDAGAGAGARGHLDGAREHHRPGQGAHRHAPRRPILPKRAESLPTPESLTAPYLALVRPGEPRRHGPAVSRRRRGLSSALRSSSSVELPELAARQALVQLRAAPMDTRSTRLTSAPCRSNSWRMSLPLAPRATMEYQRFAPSSCASLVLTLSTVMRAGRSSLPLFTPSSWSGPSKPLHAHAEFARQPVIRALQFRGQRAIGGHELEPAVDARHGAHGDEAAAGGLRQAFDQRRAFGRRPRAADRRANG